MPTLPDDPESLLDWNDLVSSNPEACGEMHFHGTRCGRRKNHVNPHAAPYIPNKTWITWGRFGDMLTNVRHSEAVELILA